MKLGGVLCYSTRKTKSGANREICAAFRFGPRIPKDGGADRVRTCDPHNAIVVLYQLSYDPAKTEAEI